jgi:hypothetical protein
VSKFGHIVFLLSFGALAFDSPLFVLKYCVDDEITNKINVVIFTVLKIAELNPQVANYIFGLERKLDLRQEADNE